MNEFILLAVVFAFFVVVDLLSARVLRIGRNILRNTGLVLLCVAALVCGACGVSRMVRTMDATLATLYNAYSYFLNENMDKAQEQALKVQNPHAELLLLLVDGWRGNYAGVLISSDDLISGDSLNEDLAEQAERIYQLSREMTGLDQGIMTEEESREELADIAEECFSLLKMSEKKEVEFLSGFQRDMLLSGDNYAAVDEDTLEDMLEEARNDRELLRYSVKYYNARNDYDMAEECASQLLKEDKSVENIVLYTDVIAQKLLNDEKILEYDEDDKEIAKWLDKAEHAESIAEKYEPGNPRYDDNIARAEEYRKQAEGVKVRRIINWLNARTPLFGDGSGIIDLQLSKLYSAAGDREKAEKLLMNLIRKKEKIQKDSPVKDAIDQLDEVYHDATASGDEISAAINTLLRTDVFLPDSVLSRGYSQFLNNWLTYERVTVFISRIDAEDYPVVRAYLNVNGRKNGVEELANDFEIGDFTFADSGVEISNKKVTRITDDMNNLVSIALVVDGSGSMDGSRIENARLAVDACISNMNPDTQELSIVMYDNWAECLCPLTNDAFALRQAAQGLRASGGTDIPSGLLAGIESLKDAVGTRAIILMTDGEDGNAGAMPDAIRMAQDENIAVFTVSTGGGEREYMENIAASTGGSYMEALESEDLVKVYTSLQSYIVNNYCFSYTVEENVEENPRVLTIGLGDYGVNSSRIYAHDGMAITKEGCYITGRADSGELRLLDAQPSMVSREDLKYGVPVFVHAPGVKDGARILINGDPVKDVRVVEDSALTFTLSGNYQPGTLNLTVIQKDGSSRSTDKLLTIADNNATESNGQSILLGNGSNILYADHVEQKDDYTLALSGNIVLNGFIRTASPVTLRAYSEILSRDGKFAVSNGEIMGNGEAFVDFALSESPENYGQLVFGGHSVRVLDAFHFYFDEGSIGEYYSGTSMELPAFGTVYGNAQINGDELVYTIDAGYRLTELQDRLNFVFNNIPLPQTGDRAAMELLTGISAQVSSDSSDNRGLSVKTEELVVTIRKDCVDVNGEGSVSGYLGSIGVADGRIIIDTSRMDAMFEISGMANVSGLSDWFELGESIPFKIQSKEQYPDSLIIHADNFSIDSDGLSECFESGVPSAIDGELVVNFPLNISDEPYQSQLSDFLDDVELECDQIEFVCTDNWRENGLIAYDIDHPEKYVRLTEEGIVIMISDEDEISLFGTDIGGEIIGEANVTNRYIELRLDVDGHLDNFYYGIRYDGKATIEVRLPRNASIWGSTTVTLTYGSETLTYNASLTGSLIPEDGFHVYAEDNGR